MRNLPKKPTETKGPKKRKQWNVNERFVIRKKNLSFVAKLTQVSTAETQPNPTKKTRQNVSKHFLKENTRKFHFETYPRANISNQNRREPTKIQVVVPIKKLIQEILLSRAGVEPAPYDL